jgi:hypothetical protein
VHADDDVEAPGRRLATDVGGQRAADPFEGVGHDSRDVDRCALAALAAAVGEDLLDERAAAGRGE